MPRVTKNKKSKGRAKLRANWNRKAKGTPLAEVKAAISMAEALKLQRGMVEAQNRIAATLDVLVGTLQEIGAELNAIRQITRGRAALGTAHLDQPSSGTPSIAEPAGDIAGSATPVSNDQPPHATGRPDHQPSVPAAQPGDFAGHAEA